MNKVPKIIVATCTYEGKHYAFDKWWKAVQKLTYPVKEVLIVDNTNDNGNYTRKLRRITQGKAKIIKVKRLSNSRDTLSYSQNYIRKYMLENGYDYWMSIESDLEVPPNTIENLLRWYKPVVGGLYEIGFENKSGRRYCVFITEKKPNGMNGTRVISQNEHEQLKNEKGLFKIHGCGIGCTLIRRDVLEKYVFWTDTRFDNKHSDVYFYMDLWNDKVPVYIDTNIEAIHHNSDWSLVGDR